VCRCAALPLSHHELPDFYIAEVNDASETTTYTHTQNCIKMMTNRITVTIKYNNITILPYTEDNK